MTFEPTSKPTFELTGRGLVLHPFVKSKRIAGREPEAALEEAVRLTEAMEIEVTGAETVGLSAVRPATLFGSGKVRDLAGDVEHFGIEVVVVNGTLTPIQQRNLERAWNCKVIDRTGLILEIFARRARTKEGVLQVELAQLTYQRSRLVRAWTHLERQRGGLGTVGGPGERQIEADRRAIDNRITMLRKQLEDVTRTRELHRKTRREAPYPVVALVGYTNAGKSTLFNRLTKAKVMAEDQLFATLDPTMRAVELPSGQRVILSDTVGFISDLPTHLVAAFRATLEEVLEADVIVHVRDIAHPESRLQRDDVVRVLADLGVDVDQHDAIVEACNKYELLDEEARETVDNMLNRRPESLAVSALTGLGCEALLQRIDLLISANRELHEVDLAPEEGEAMAWLYRHGDVVEQAAGDDGRIHLQVRLDPADFGRFQKRYIDAQA